MANKYTVTITATITTEAEQPALLSRLLTAVNTTGSSVLVQSTDITQWVDQTVSKAQKFNLDGTPSEE